MRAVVSRNPAPLSIILAALAELPLAMLPAAPQTVVVGSITTWLGVDIMTNERRRTSYTHDLDYP